MNKNKQVSKTEEKRKSMVDKRIVLDATIQSLCKLNPKIQIKNPVMFVVRSAELRTAEAGIYFQ